MAEEKRFLFVITGSGQGLGSYISLSLSNAFPFSDFIFLSRNLSLANETAKKILNNNNNNSENHQTFVYEVDLSNGQATDQTILHALSQIPSEKQYQACYLINNAGSLGPLCSVSDLLGPLPLTNSSTSTSTNNEVNTIQKVIDLNVTSPFIVTSRFIQYSKSRNWKAIIVNISSLAAIQPFETWSVYCSGKAARDMLMSVIAKEGVRTLNYAPGPLDTNMQAEIRQCSHQPTRDFFIDMHLKGGLVQPKDSADVLTRLLKEDTFESGQHLDYFDVKEGKVPKTSPN
jgi:sepiapterin reductase